MAEREPLVNKSGKPWRNTAGEMYDPQILFFGVEDLLHYEKLYRDAGKLFLPAVQQGSSAAAHLFARWERPRDTSKPASVRADTRKYLTVANSIRNSLGKELFIAQCEAAARGVSVDAANADFRQTHRAKLGKTEVERDKHFDKVSKAAYRARKKLDGA